MYVLLLTRPPALLVLASASPFHAAGRESAEPCHVCVGAWGWVNEHLMMTLGKISVCAA